MKPRQTRGLLKVLSACRGERLALSFLTECADATKIGGIRGAAVWAVPCCYRAVSAVHMRRKVLDKRQKVDCVSIMQDGAVMPHAPCPSPTSWLSYSVCGRRSAGQMYLFGGFGMLW